LRETRTRFAPSPTGYMHIGNLRTALYTYLIAKHDNGKFILRIEDTDQKRYVEDAVDVIYKTLNIVGLKHDEGPDIGGDYGPYVQSERRDIYKKYAKKLVELGGAYYCFCSRERLDSLRKQAEENKTTFKYDGHCKSLSTEEVEERLAAGEPYTIRQLIPETGKTTFEDAVYGSITVENSELDEGVLLKTDGLPTYNFANVVDDNLMGITHVIRGSEYLSSAPKYNLLYNAFGWEIPTYIHLPLIMKEGGRKLSKREGDASFEDFYEKGYLAEAITNYIALLGWSPGTEQEFFTLNELIEQFDIKGLSKSPAVFDVNKLRWMNGEYIRKMSVEDFHKLALPYYKKYISSPDADLNLLSKLLHTRVDVLEDIEDHVDFIDTLPQYDIDLFIHKRMKTTHDNALASLEKAYEVLTDLEDWREDTIHELLFDTIKEMGIKNGQMLWPIRTALSGKPSSPGGGTDLLALLGKNESLKRIKIGMEKLS
jgi:glutamyl-tRNA synthetase